jgi:4-hydroxymandelate oxidase
MDGPRDFLTLDDFEPAARAALPDDVYGFIAGAAGDEWTHEENRRAFDRWILRPRVLRGVGGADPSVRVLDVPLSMPVLVAPWAYQRAAHRDGEIGTARAAARAGTVMCVSTTALDILEEIAAATDGPKWWQLYVFTDRSYTQEMLARVVGSGFGAIVWTVDLNAYGLRHRETRSGYEPPISPTTEDLAYDVTLSWDDIPWIRQHTRGLPLVVKGILTREDAELAVQAGVDGIVVSNHGGRQLDTSSATLDALPEVVEAVDGRVPVLLDGGIRRGTDVVKALALGATAVLVGRPAAWGLAVAGEDGVTEVLRILRDEIENAMTLCGCQTVADITPAHVARASA